MNDRELADFAREHGLDIGEYEDNYVDNSYSGYAQAVQPQYYSDDIDEYSDDIELRSSPSPPDRSDRHYRAERVSLEKGMSPLALCKACAYFPLQIYIMESDENMCDNSRKVGQPYAELVNFRSNVYPRPSHIYCEREDHEKILSEIALFLVDEVHILNESRGISATVPNIQDVAGWIGKGPEGGPATVMEFGEEYRPCKLTRIVYGVQRKKDQNDFMFTRLLDFRLYGILKQHSVDKPVLVFCATRKAAHTVVIKGVKIFQNNASQEYSDLDIMQMMGRAGRPQFDKEGIAIIMCETELEAKYKALAQGRTVLESCLHLNLTEHINSEIGLGTIINLQSAKHWLHNSFLFQRIRKNPRHYAIGKDNGQSWQARIDEMVTQSIQKLQDGELVAPSEKGDDSLTSTEYGDIMSKWIFDPVQIYNKLRNHDDIRFKLKKVEKPCDKIILIIQAVLGGITLNDPEYKNGDNQPQLEAFTIFKHVSRVTRAMVEIAIVKRSGAQVKHGMELLKVLAQHGITSFETLGKQDSMRIEMLLGRRPPFGNEILALIKQLPRYSLNVTQTNVNPSDGKNPVEVDISVDCGLLEEAGCGDRKKNKTKARNATLIVTVTSDLDFIDFRRISSVASQVREYRLTLL
ncbi:hypothetical protein EW026_g2490 [Hermanssonia centrifuga]|uniref:DNA 3'-5' helicase n=1 Tax=Hermanssonia centrifuga TaxID=98765 RepID=A0A4S4KP63_9APHY|nr:hypothetical protein EW026_g2490 [Hermanssonia centrifuga]